MSRKEGTHIKKRQIVALALAAGAGAWCAHRDRKYPVRQELRFANKLTAPRLGSESDDRKADQSGAGSDGAEAARPKGWNAWARSVSRETVRPSG